MQQVTLRLHVKIIMKYTNGRNYMYMNVMHMMQLITCVMGMSWNYWEFLGIPSFLGIYFARVLSLLIWCGGLR